MLLEQGLIALSLASAVISIALGVLCLRAIQRLGTFSIEDAPERQPIDVIVPARNEERDLQTAIQSILSQQSVELRLIVINDHSTDRTGDIADSMAEADDRVLVIHNPPVRKGWFGKVNAMQNGLSVSTAPIIVFTDADVIHGSRCFASALAGLQQDKLDFLSLSPA